MDRAWGLQEVEAPRFQDSRHMKVVRLSVLHTGRLYPTENIPVRDWTYPRVVVDRKDYVNEKFQWHHLESNHRPSDL